MKRNTILYFLMGFIAYFGVYATAAGIYRQYGALPFSPYAEPIVLAAFVPIGILAWLASGLQRSCGIAATVGAVVCPILGFGGMYFHHGF